MVPAMMMAVPPQMAMALLALALPVLVGGAETFDEALTLRRIPGAAAMATFEFNAGLNITEAAAMHTELFPVSMVQLLQAHRLSELRLSMSSGYWREAWGGGGSVPPGLALSIDATEGEAAWSGASSAVSGMFCPALASLRYEDTVTPAVFGGGRRGRLYATKPQEVMCKDHLGSFTRLLPCGAGGAARSSLAAALSHALTLSNSQYLAVELVLSATPRRGDGAELAYRMSLVVSAVLHRAPQVGSAASSLRQSFADVRELPGTFLSVPEPAEAVLPACCLCGLPSVTSQLVLRHGDASGQPTSSAFDLTEDAGRSPDRVPSDRDREFGTAFRSFWDAGATRALSAGMVAQEEGDGQETEAPILSGLVAGAANSFRTLVLQQTVTNPSAHKALVIVLWQPIPWLLELKLSTLAAAVDVDAAGGWNALTTPILLSNAHMCAPPSNFTSAGATMTQRFGMLAAWVQPSRRIGRGGPTGDADATAGPRRSPGSLELVLRLPPSSTATVSVSAERSFLYFSDFPSDAARGTDIAAPAGAYYYSDVDSGDSPAGAAAVVAALLADTEPDGIVYAAAGMLVPVAWPDFSSASSHFLSSPSHFPMAIDTFPRFAVPYNVICISCTLPMIVFGAITSGTVSVPVVGGHKPRPVHAFILWFLRTCDQLFGG